MGRAATVEELFGVAAGRLVEEDAAIEQGRILHSTGLKTGGKFFGFVTRGELVVKLRAERVDELVSSGAGLRFDAGKGRPMREWVRLRPADEAACVAHLREAHGFVAAQAATAR
jgi:hypothetical protein